MLQIKPDTQEDLERRLTHYILVIERCRDNKRVVEHSKRAFIQMYEIMKYGGYRLNSIHDELYETYKTNKAKDTGDFW